MAENDFSSFARYYDQIYLKMKDYESESQAIENIIRKFEKRPFRSILDVGCGTGEHLKYLSRHFQCSGIDISKEMIEAARTKIPDAKFEVADMKNLRLEARFDVVMSLFGSIGYVQNIKNLMKTLSNFHTHLNGGGLAIVEPWVFKKNFLRGRFSIDTYEDEKLKLVRMGTSKLTRSHWLVIFHYLIGAEDRIEHKREIHKMLAAEYEDYMNAFKMAGFSAFSSLDKNMWPGSRGLFVAFRQ
jgi:ubiquinone/menaquinone biosynthesis C-methylase UbiE